MRIWDELPDDGDEYDDADEAALQDTGRPWGAWAIKHPSHAGTVAHLKAHPMPQQADRRSA